MRKKRLAWLAASCVLLGGLTAVFAAGGADDPIVSVSWLYNIMAPKYEEQFQTEIDERLNTLGAEYDRRMDALSFAEKTDFDYAGSFEPLELRDGGSVTLDEFARFRLTDGQMRLLAENCEILDLSSGEVCPNGTYLEPYHTYFAAEGSGAVLRAYSEAEGYADGYYRCEASGEFPVRERFPDVETHWAREQIWRLAELGLVNGTAAHTFSPDAKVTRAMFVTVLGRLIGADAQSGSSGFADVKESDWFAPYVMWASENGIVYGDNGRFSPNSNLTREQMAAILVRFCSAFGYVLPEVNEEITFTDAEQISAWAADSVRLAQKAGLVNGRSSGAFDPRGTATRAEMCAVISRLYEKLNLTKGDTEG